MLHSVVAVPQHTLASAWLHASTCRQQHLPLHVPTAAQAWVRGAGGHDSHAQLCSLALPAWSGAWWYRSAAGVEGCRAPCYGSMCVFVTSSGGVPVHASACGHACGDTALLHMHSPEPQGALRQR